MSSNRRALRAFGRAGMMLAMLAGGISLAVASDALVNGSHPTLGSWLVQGFAFASGAMVLVMLAGVLTRDRRQYGN
jgi:Na+/H+ antiporter NhaC